MSVAAVDRLLLVGIDRQTAAQIGAVLAGLDECCILSAVSAEEAPEARTSSRTAAVFADATTAPALIDALLGGAADGKPLIAICADHAMADALAARGAFDAVVAGGPRAEHDLRRAITHALAVHRSRLAAYHETLRSEARRRQTNSGFFDLAPDATPVMVDPIAYTLTGLLIGASGTAQRILGEIHPEDRDKTLAAFQRVRQGKRASVEYRRPGVDGVDRRLSCVVSPVVTDDGEVIALVGGIADVTERREIAERERVVRSQLAAVFENSPAVMYFKGTDLRYRFVNGPFCRAVDRTAEEIIGRKDAEIFGEEHPDVWKERDLVVLHADGPQTFEDEIDGRDGKPRRYSSVQFAVKDSDGQTIGVCGLISDVTERRQTEERLRRSFDDAPQGIALAAADGTWMRVNRALADLLGYREEELVDRPETDFLHPDEVAAGHPFPTAGAQPVTREQRFLRRDGSTVWVLSSMEAVRDGQGRLQWRIVHLLDITQRKQMEDELQRQQLDMLAIAGVAREAGTAERPTDEVCRAAHQITGASTVALLELRSPERLVLTAPARGDLPIGHEVRLEGAPTGAALCAMSRERLFLGEARHQTVLGTPLGGAGEPRSVVYEPVLRGGDLLGVLMLGWAEPREHLSPRESSVIRLLAAEMATTIERSRLTAQLRELARTDPLTGLGNRRVWDERIAVELSHAERIGHSVCVALIDLDHFKRYNDSRGHQAGDRLLSASTAAWAGELRTGDLLARIGGDEFAALLPDCDLEASQALVERLRLATPSDATCSVGVVQWDREEEPETLIARADAALYAAKESGRARSVVG